MTINIPDGVLKKIGLGLMSLLAVVGVVGIVSAVNNRGRNSLETSNAPQEQTETGSFLGLSSEETQASTNPSPATSTATGTSSSSDSQPQITYASKLTAESVSRYEKCWSLFTQYDSYLSSGNYSAAMAVQGSLSINGVGGIEATSISNDALYTTSIITSAGEVWTLAAQAYDNYSQARTYLDNDPNLYPDYIQKGQQFLTDARSKLSQAKSRYAAIPK